LFQNLLYDPKERKRRDIFIIKLEK